MNFFGTFGSTDEEAFQLFLPVVDRALFAHQVDNYQEYLSVVISNLAEKVTEQDSKLRRLTTEIQHEYDRFKNFT